MRLSAILFGLVFICAAIGVAVPPQDGEDVRGAFLTSRPKEKKASSSSTRPSRRRPKNTSAKTTEKTTEGSTVSSGATGTPGISPGSKGTTGASAKSDARPVNLPRLGIGLTLFSRDSNGLAVRVDPTRVFQKGDRVRILLETNTDGYLYIFNRTDDGPPVMIYPDAQIDEGGNYLQAHVPFEIPDSAATEERFRWFAFDENTGTEKVIFVFTREPLKDVPIDDDLIAFCRNGKCPWPVATGVWELVQAQMQEPLKTDRNDRFGGEQTTAEHNASTRGLGLAKDDPQPSLIMMATSRKSTLVATLDLIHK